MVEERCVANLLDPAWKGVHLKVKSKFETTKELIKRRWAYLVDKNHGRADQEPSVAVPLSPTSKLLREAGVMPDVGLGGGLAAELLRFESLPRLEKDGDCLLWWRRKSTNARYFAIYDCEGDLYHSSIFTHF